jgi:hypothetical protein
MNWVIINDKDIKHYLTISKGVITIIRTRTCGGTPRTIIKHYESDIGFDDCINKIRTIVSLDDELYDMVVESQ